MKEKKLGKEREHQAVAAAHRPPIDSKGIGYDSIRTVRHTIRESKAAFQVLQLVPPWTHHEGPKDKNDLLAMPVIQTQGKGQKDQGIQGQNSQNKKGCMTCSFPRLSYQKKGEVS